MSQGKLDIRQKACEAEASAAPGMSRKLTLGNWDLSKAHQAGAAALRSEDAVRDTVARSAGLMKDAMVVKATGSIGNVDRKTCSWALKKKRIRKTNQKNSFGLHLSVSRRWSNCASVLRSWRLTRGSS